MSLAAASARGGVGRASTSAVGVDRDVLGTILLASRKRWTSRALLRHWASVFETWTHPIDAITRRPAANRYLMAGVRGGASASGSAAQLSLAVPLGTGTGTGAIWGPSSSRARNSVVVGRRGLRG